MKPPYKITQTILELFGEINQSLGMCKSLLLVKPEARLRKQNRIKTIHSSLAIEGNTLNISHVTALFNNQKIIGPEKDIREVKNAIEAYETLHTVNPHSQKDFLKIHSIFLNGLVSESGKYRRSQVGIMKGDKVSHIAPGFEMVPGLMNNLFDYLKNDKDLNLIKSCVFHYEMEFIHPFEDGNGRMGRIWQTRLLMNVNPIFEYVPIEKLIKENQEKYYHALELSDSEGESTSFIEFILGIINTSLKETIQESGSVNNDFYKRSEYALDLLNDWFDRKEYISICKGISTATASRDLKRLLEERKIESSGTGRMTKYRKRNG
jgi:Fic family protein